MMSDHWNIKGPPVGMWKVPCANLYFECHTKPRWLTRFLMRVLAQWEWEEGV